MLGYPVGIQQTVRVAMLEEPQVEVLPTPGATRDDLLGDFEAFIR